MIRNLFLTLLIFLTLLSCGYSSIYSKNTKTNFSITSIDLEGDNEINNHIIRKLSKYKNINDEKKYSINGVSIYNKIPVAKDKTGKATKYELVASINLQIINNKKSTNLSVTETFKIDNDDDNFEQFKYEKKVKNNLSKLLLEELMLNLIKIE